MGRMESKVGQIRVNGFIDRHKALSNTNSTSNSI